MIKDTILGYVPCIRRFLRQRYSPKNDITELPEVRVDGRKTVLVDDVHPSQRISYEIANESSHAATRKKGYRDAAAAGIEERICEVTPLVQKICHDNKQEVVLETQPMATTSTYITDN